MSSKNTKINLNKNSFKKLGVMDKMVGLFALNFSCGQNGWSFF